MAHTLTPVCDSLLSYGLYLRPLLEIKCNSCRKNSLLHWLSFYQLFAVRMECPVIAILDCIHNKQDHHRYNKNLSTDKRILNRNLLYLQAVNNFLVSKIIFYNKSFSEYAYIIKLRTSSKMIITTISK